MTLEVSIVQKVLSIATALALSIWGLSPSEAQTTSSVLQSLPAEVQKQIEDVRAACREYLVAVQSTAHGVASVSSDDEGLRVFTVSGAQAVMINDWELCDGCFKGANCSNRGSYSTPSTSAPGKPGGRRSRPKRPGRFS
jgi:hypothetical protein